MKKIIFILLLITQVYATTWSTAPFMKTVNNAGKLWLTEKSAKTNCCIYFTEGKVVYWSKLYTNTTCAVTNIILVSAISATNTVIENPDEPEPESEPVIFTNVVTTIAREPYLQNGSGNSMTIMWRSLSNANGVVNYGTTTSYGNSVTTAYDKIHEAVLTGLTPDTKYYYEISNGLDTNKAWFVTFPTNRNASTTFVINGDFHSTLDSFKRRQQGLVIEEDKYNPLFCLMVGDAVMDGESLDDPQWDFYLNSISGLVDKTPLYIATGNHEYNDEGVLATGYIDNFSFPTNGSNSELYYSFNCGNVCVIVMELHQSAQSTYLPETPQFIFVTNTLATTKMEWKVIMAHNPIFDSGRSGVWGRDTWSTTIASNMWIYYVPEFEKYGVNMYVSGHDHFYERSVKSNITYIISSVQTGYDSGWLNPYSEKMEKDYGAAFVCAVTGAYMYCSAIHGYSDYSTTNIDNFIITNNTVIANQAPTCLFFDDLYLWYPFLENGAIDQSGNHRNGTVIGAMYNGPGEGYTFNGISNAILSSTFDLNVFTISAWVKSNYAGEQTLFGENSNTWVLTKVDDELKFKNAGSADYVINESLNADTDTDWHHVVLRVNGSSDIDFYWDGVKLINGNTDRPISDLTVLGFGANNDDNTLSTGFNGTMDDIRVYNRNLGSSDIIAIRDAGRYN